MPPCTNQNKYSTMHRELYTYSSNCKTECYFLNQTWLVSWCINCWRHVASKIERSMTLILKIAEDCVILGQPHWRASTGESEFTKSNYYASKFTAFPVRTWQTPLSNLIWTNQRGWTKTDDENRKLQSRCSWFHFKGQGAKPEVSCAVLMPSYHQVKFWGETMASGNSFRIVRSSLSFEPKHCLFVYGCSRRNFRQNHNWGSFSVVVLSRMEKHAKCATHIVFNASIYIQYPFLPEPRVNGVSPCCHRTKTEWHPGQGVQCQPAIEKNQDKESLMLTDTDP